MAGQTTPKKLTSSQGKAVSAKKIRRQPRVNRRLQNAMALRCRVIGATTDIVREAGQDIRLTIDLPCPLPRRHPMKI